MQRALIQYRNLKNYDLVYEALVKAGRTDLIGFDKKCLICPALFSIMAHIAFPMVLILTLSWTDQTFLIKSDQRSEEHTSELQSQR